MKAKKSLGQNFLKSIPAIKSIISAGEVKNNDIVLEIGPGKGILTQKLLENAEKVIAIEKDNELYNFLSQKFEKEIQCGKLILENKDILEFDIEKYGLKPVNYKVIANIPYNITGAILKKFLSSRNQPNLMVLMVQNEVAQRIVARSGKESILSISVKAYGEPKIIMKVPSRYFTPPPKVDSAVILIKNISKNGFREEKIDEIKFWELIKTGFAHKRKVLAGNLKELNKKNDWQKSLIAINLNPKIRAEELSIEDWKKLYHNTQSLF